MRYNGRSRDAYTFTQKFQSSSLQSEFRLYTRQCLAPTGISLTALLQGTALCSNAFISKINKINMIFYFSTAKIFCQYFFEFLFWKNQVEIIICLMRNQRRPPLYLSRSHLHPRQNQGKTLPIFSF